MATRHRTSSGRGNVGRNAGRAYPGHIIKVGIKDNASVRAVQQRLNEVGCGPLLVSGDFNSSTRSAVRLFQARTVDGQGQALKVDSVVGPLTWTALFGQQALPAITDQPISLLLKACLNIAASQVGVMEDPAGSNRGPQVDEYIRSVRLDPSAGSYPWCAAFVYWSFERAAARVGIANPVVCTAGVLDHWKKAAKAGARLILPEELLDDLSLLKPGLIFTMSTGGGNGHMGLVEGFRDDRLITIEGNTNLSGGREGIGVFRRTGRKVSEITKGFISYDS
ncbi:Peptidoglycan-binding domain 1 protein [Nitrospira japonica]|uniref:Peptidoglycan-binding domain 1 protein n=1 Tax=Nitrospira japonica TaxID=1325564 RepID=A0A1W1I3L4_9BACT|nr:peptidoglycan-binding protein [Nitrospira japonica]SLM47433.1 Peptidoglycan-binding domain 1 protein [Nitrospira japonica]